MHLLARPLPAQFAELMFLMAPNRSTQRKRGTEVSRLDAASFPIPLHMDVLPAAETESPKHLISRPTALCLFLKSQTW